MTQERAGDAEPGPTAAAGSPAPGAPVRAVADGRDTARARLAAAQEELARALLAGAPPPPGFDERRIAVEARALLNKRTRVAELIRADAAAELGDRWRPLFREYAHAHPRAVGTTWREDADGFVRWLVDHGHLPERRPAPRRRWWRLGR